MLAFYLSHFNDFAVEIFDQKIQRAIASNLMANASSLHLHEQIFQTVVIKANVTLTIAIA